MTPYEIIKIVIDTITIVILAVKVTVHVVEFLLKTKNNRPPR